MKTKNDYTEMQKSYYNKTSHVMNTGNHRIHDRNPDYWDILLKPFSSGDFSNKKGLDFGCGCGRNVINVLDNYDIGEMHGCDISEENIKFCFENLKNTSHDNYNFFVSDGQSLNPSKENNYDIIISTIVLQHICVYEIRKSILTDMYRCLKEGGILSFQMGFGNAKRNARDYYDNYYEAEGTNSKCDTKVTDPQQLINDLKDIGFKSIIYTIKKSYCDEHGEWIFIECKK